MGGSEDIRLPMGSGLTGFWSTDPTHAINLVVDIEATIEEMTGGCLWADEVLVLEANVTPASDEVLESHRTGKYVERYDGSEVFVELPPEDVKTYLWEEFLRR